MVKQWKAKENKDAKLFGARKTPRSGGLWFAKADSKSDTFLIENKTTEHEGYTVTERLWEKIEREGLLSKRIPLLSIEFGKNKRELVILDKNDFVSLLPK